MAKKSIIEVTVECKDVLKKLEYLLGFSSAGNGGSGEPPRIHIEIRDGVGVGDETSSGAQHDVNGETINAAPGDVSAPPQPPHVDRSTAIFDPHRFGVNASELPYKTSAAYAALASRNLQNYERKYAMAHERCLKTGRNEALMPEFTNDIGKVVIPLVETVLRIPNLIARRDFICTFLGYYAARCYGYTLDYDSIDDLMEVWRREKDHTNDNSSMTQGLQELMSLALSTLSQPILPIMRVPGQ